MSALKCILHIGTEKSGTTSIQSFLQKNRDIFLENDYYIPIVPSISPTNFNHRKLATAMLDTNHVDDARKVLKIQNVDSFSNWRNVFLEQLSEEINNNNTYKKYIFSSEHLSSRLVSTEEIIRLKVYLQRFFDTVEVILYIRRQDKYAVSLYSTALKAGSVYDFTFNHKNPVNGRFDYYRMYSKWSEVFGKRYVDVRIFERDNFYKKDLTLDFLKAVGLHESVINGTQWLMPAKANPSLNAFGQSYLRYYNAINPKGLDPRLHKQRRHLIEFLERNYGGNGYLPTQSEAIEWYGFFEKVNNKLLLELESSTDQLFDTNFDSYPEERDCFIYTSKDFLDVSKEFSKYLIDINKVN